MKKFERFNSEHEALNHLEDLVSQGVNQEDLTVVSKHRLIDLPSKYTNVTFKDAEGGIMDKIASLFSGEEPEDKVLSSLDLNDAEREESRQAIDQEQVIVFNAYHDFKGALDGERFDMSEHENQDGFDGTDKKAATLAGAQFGSHDAGREPMFNEEEGNDLKDDSVNNAAPDSESLDDDEGARENAFNDDREHDINDPYLKERKDDEEFDTDRFDEGMDTDNERNKLHEFGKDHPKDGVSELDKDKVDNHNNADEFTEDHGDINNVGRELGNEEDAFNNEVERDNLQDVSSVDDLENRPESEPLQNDNRDPLHENNNLNNLSDDPDSEEVRLNTNSEAIRMDDADNKDVAAGRENLDPDYRDDDRMDNDMNRVDEEMEENDGLPLDHSDGDDIRDVSDSENLNDVSNNENLHDVSRVDDLDGTSRTNPLEDNRNINNLSEDPDSEDVRLNTNSEAIRMDDQDNKDVAAGRENLDPNYRDDNMNNTMNDTHRDTNEMNNMDNNLNNRNDIDSNEIKEAESADRDNLIERSDNAVERRTVNADRASNDTVDNWRNDDSVVDDAKSIGDFDNANTNESFPEDKEPDSEDEADASQEALDQANDVDYDDPSNDDKRSSRLDDTLRADEAREDAFDHDKGRF